MSELKCMHDGAICFHNCSTNTAIDCYRKQYGYGSLSKPEPQPLMKRAQDVCNACGEVHGSTKDLQTANDKVAGLVAVVKKLGFKDMNVGSPSQHFVECLYCGGFWTYGEKEVHNPAGCDLNNALKGDVKHE